MQFKNEEATNKRKKSDDKNKKMFSLTILEMKTNICYIKFSLIELAIQ